MDTSFTNETGGFLVLKDNGINLAAVLKVKKPESTEVVLILHGLFTGKHYPLIQKINKLMEYNSVIFDFTGCGDSDGRNLYRMTNHLDQVEDVRAVVDFLRLKGITVKMIVGHSKGANVSLLYASQYDDVPKGVSVAARFDMDKILDRFRGTLIEQNILTKGKHTLHTDGRDWTITIDDWNNAGNIDMTVVKNITNTDILMIHGTDDEVIPLADLHTFKSHMTKSYESLEIAGANHAFDDQYHVDLLVTKLNEFMAA